MPGDDQRAGVREGLVVAAGNRRRTGLVGRGRALAHGHRLAGQQRFVDAQAGRFGEHHVGGHALAFGDQHQVAGHQIERGDSLHPAVADDARLGRGQIAQGIERPLASAFLVDHESDRDEREERQQQTFAQVADGQVDAGGQQQEIEHGLRCDAAQRLQQAVRVAAADLVASDLGLAPARFGAAETGE